MAAHRSEDTIAFIDLQAQVAQAADNQVRGEALRGLAAEARRLLDASGISGRRRAAAHLRQIIEADDIEAALHRLAQEIIQPELAAVARDNAQTALAEGHSDLAIGVQRLASRAEALTD